MDICIQSLYLLMVLENLVLLFILVKLIQLPEELLIISVTYTHMILGPHTLSLVLWSRTPQ